ncbi:hypothetical protein AB0J25_09640 [Streptomyces sp. NPDC049910]|uniref:hypothetical protein n=1 Tax=Streptomyces sp. NPDC049910 TaxID=3155278 RepID=UPI0034454C93
MAENEAPEGPEPEQVQDSADVDQGEPVDLSRFYASTIKPLQEYLDGQNAQIRKMLTGMAAAQMRPTLPRIVVENPLIRMSAAAETLRKQVADMTGFNDMIRQALQPMHDFYPAQWQNVFASLAEATRRLYPENLRDAAPQIRDLEKLLVDEGIPLMWVPGPRTVRALLDAPTAVARRRTIGQRWEDIVEDCEAVLEEVKHPAMQDACGFALDVVAALRAGHTNPAQALAANLLDSLLQRHFDKAARVQLTNNDFKSNGIKFQLDDYKFKVACTFAPVWYAHAKYYPKNGDPIPRTFGRHPSAHGVSRAQYSRINALYALMLVTSVIKFFDTELPS